MDAHIGSYIFYEDLYRSNRITTYVVPFVIGMLLARGSVVGISIPSSISLPAGLFTRYVMQHPVTNSLATLLARTRRVRELCRHDRDSSPVNNQ